MAASPFDPLSPAEIRSAAAVIQRHFDDAVPGGPWVLRFAQVDLLEPPKEEIWADCIAKRAQRTLPLRQAHATFIVPKLRASYEAVICLKTARVEKLTKIDRGQPLISIDEANQIERTVRQSHEFLAALQKRLSISGLSMNEVEVMVEPWSAGHYGLAQEEGKRLVRAVCWVQRKGDAADTSDNFYAHPVEGVVAVVDLHEMKVMHVEDYGVIPIPMLTWRFGKPNDKDPRMARLINKDNPASSPPVPLRPLYFQQPDGPSYILEGRRLRWWKWDMFIGFNSREGLTLHAVTFGGVSVLYRASVSEMVVPYGDPAAPHYRHNAFDVGEYGLGMCAVSLKRGCDCAGGDIQYLDAVVAGGDGTAVTIENAICIHEEDSGLLWKHVEWRDGRSHVRRARRLVVSFWTAIGNYDYGFFWYFCMDGTIQLEIKHTGVVKTKAVMTGMEGNEVYSSAVAGGAGSGLVAPVHTHWYSVRLDMDVGSRRNSVYEVDFVPSDKSAGTPENLHGNGFRIRQTLLKTEATAKRNIDAVADRCWRIAESTTGRAYVLKPHGNAVLRMSPTATVLRRASFLRHHLWVTPYHASERYACGDHPNQHSGGDGLSAWTAANRSVCDTDVVVWYTMGLNHWVRPEDWPVMPIATLAFSLMPHGFAPYNPTLDAPEPIAEAKL